MSSDQPKDVMIKFRSTIPGKNSKGGDRLQLYLSPEEAEALMGELQAAVKAGGERGAKLDIHTSEKEHDGRKFKSSIAFVKAVQEGTNGTGGGAGRPAPKKFVPKQVVTA